MIVELDLLALALYRSQRIDFISGQHVPVLSNDILAITRFKRQMEHEVALELVIGYGNARLELAQVQLRTLKAMIRNGTAPDNFDELIDKLNDEINTIFSQV